MTTQPDNTSPILFADSTTPRLIPGSFSHVMAYPNGRYAWPPAQLARFPWHVEIAVRAGQPEQATFARELDIELFDAGVADFRPFAGERHALGHDDATAYCSLNLVPALVRSMAGSRLPWRLHAAWWWGQDVPPTRDQVLRELLGVFGVSLPPNRLWACQFMRGPNFDTSVLYGADDFTVRYRP